MFEWPAKLHRSYNQDSLRRAHHAPMDIHKHLAYIQPILCLSSWPEDTRHSCPQNFLYGWVVLKLYIIYALIVTHLSNIVIRTGFTSPIDTRRWCKESNSAVFIWNVIIFRTNKDDFFGNSCTNENIFQLRAESFHVDRTKIRNQKCPVRFVRVLVEARR